MSVSSPIPSFGSTLSTGATPLGLASPLGLGANAAAIFPTICLGFIWRSGLKSHSCSLQSNWSQIICSLPAAGSPVSGWTHMHMVPRHWEPEKRPSVEHSMSGRPGTGTALPREVMYFGVPNRSFIWRHFLGISCVPVRVRTIWKIEFFNNQDFWRNVRDFNVAQYLLSFKVSSQDFNH